MRNIQATGNIYGQTITINQVSKAKAKKLFAAGKDIYLQSSNMYPFGVWQSVCPINIAGFDSSFEEHVNNYTYYNCDNERGKYVTFYAKHEDI